MTKYFIALVILITSCLSTHAQHSLQPGFDGNEYRNILKIGFNVTDTSAKQMGIKPQAFFHMVYRSKEVGLYNRWDLWTNEEKKVAVINIRGTIANKESWLENFYAAMIPAMGSLKINDSTVFDYKMAQDSNAHVHVGWMLGVAYLGPDIVNHIKEYYAKGFKDFIISGHSQGGALALLMRSYVEYNGDLPKDIQYKMYASAAPKPGNLNYAYDLDFITRNGWGYRVVNTLDWVPETPFSIQTTGDFNEVNGITSLRPAVKKQKFYIRWAFNSAYNGMDRTTKKAVKKQQKYLGHFLYKVVKKSLPQFVEPSYVKSNNYMTAGVPIVLKPDNKYKELFPYDGKNSFVNHAFLPYLYLSEIWYP